MPEGMDDDAQRRGPGDDPNRHDALTPDERPFYPDEVAEAVALLEALAAELDGGDRHDGMFAARFRGVARGVESDGVDLARSRAFRRRHK